MKTALVTLGCLPFIIGGLMDRAMTANPDLLPPFALTGILLLLIWGAAAYFARPHMSGKDVAVLLNLIPAIALILLGVQELILGAYWRNFTGMWTQFYYLPLLRIGFALTSWSSSVFAAHCASFALLVAASLLGCRLRRARSKRLNLN